MGGGAWWAAVHGIAKSRTRLSDFTSTFHFRALEKEMATHFSVLAWRIPGTGSLVAAVYGVTQSRRWLKRLSSSSSKEDEVTLWELMEAYSVVWILADFLWSVESYLAPDWYPLACDHFSVVFLRHCAGTGSEVNGPSHLPAVLKSQNSSTWSPGLRQLIGPLILFFLGYVDTPDP